MPLLVNETRGSRFGRPKEEVECELARFDEQFHHFLSPETEFVLTDGVVASAEVKGMAKEMAASIFNNWNLLNQMLSRHEELIRKLWNKLEPGKKKNVLLSAWPEMCERHRPDVASLSRDPSSLYLNEENYNAFGWPYINLEDLLLPNALLIFLNARGRNHPDVFAYSDLELSPLYKRPNEYPSVGQDLSTMFFLGKKSADEYGSFLEWKTVADLSESINTGRSVYINHGLQILGIQDQLWAFLCKCTKIILQDSDSTTLCMVAEQSEPPQLTETDNHSLGPRIFSRLSPYRVPSKLDLRRLQALVHAQKSEAINHVMALKQDPAYFKENVELFRDHRPELLPFQSGSMHDDSKDCPLYNMTIAHLATDAYGHVFYWDHIHASLSKLQDLSLKYAHKITIGEDLPPDYLKLFTDTRFFLENFSLDLISAIKTMYPSSPPLRRYYRLLNEARSDDAILTPVRIRHINVSEASNPIVHHVLEMLQRFEDKKLRKRVTLPVLLDELERLMRDEPDAKDFISPLLTAYFSKLSIVVACLDQFHQYQPWAKRIEQDIRDDLQQFYFEYGQLICPWTDISDTAPKFTTTEIYKVGNPKDGKFYYPANKPRSRETVKAMIAAETALDLFWKKADSVWRHYAGVTMGGTCQGASTKAPN
jgi:hypothetical protein